MLITAFTREVRQEKFDMPMEKMERTKANPTTARTMPSISEAAKPAVLMLGEMLFMEVKR